MFLDEQNSERTEFITQLKVNKLFPEEKKNTNKSIKEKLVLKNVLFYHNLSKLYNLDEKFYFNKMSSFKLILEGNRLLRSATMRHDPKIVRLNGEVYAVGGYDDYKVNYVKKKINNNAWSMIGCNFHQSYGFCVCGFDGKLFIIGGYTLHYEITNTCLEFDVKERKFSQICGMKVPRSDAACAEYDGKIVVCGGVDRHYNDLKSVESYDVAQDRWSPMPSMVFEKSGHSLVVAECKLFVLDRVKCEVYDKISRKFVGIKPAPLLKEFTSILIALIERTGESHSYFGISSIQTCIKVQSRAKNRKSFSKFLRNFFCIKN